MQPADRIAERPEDVGVDSRKIAALFERAAREVDQGLLPSAQLAVAREGRIAAMRTFGHAEFLGEARPATDETLYDIFSCTKAITSAAAWLLWQEGAFSLDDRVADLVPGFGENGKGEIRVEQLFLHTAGFPHAPFRPPEFLDRDARHARFARWRLNWEPGSRFEYHPSSSMYVIADIIESTSGQRFADFVRDRIARPLGLADFHCGLPEALHGRMADLVLAGEEMTDAEYEALGFPKPPMTEVTPEAILRFNAPAFRSAGIPGGGGTTSAADLALFYQALLMDASGAPGAPGVWKSDTMAEALRVRTGDLTDPVFGKPVNRGLGVVIAGDEDRTFRCFGHTNSPHAFGHAGAGGQVAWADPATGLSFVYLTNGYDQHAVRQARRSIGLSSRAADCAL